MSIRKHCDRCDARIQDEDLHWSIVVKVSDNYKRKDLLVDTLYVSPESAGTTPMLCEKCMKEILRVILDLNKPEPEGRIGHSA